MSVALRAYLGIAIGWASLPAGALALAMMMRLIGGAWREDLALPIARICRVLPFAGLAFVPVLLTLHWIYPWSGHPEEGWSAFKTFYLGGVFFALRSIAYFAIWIWLARGRVAAPFALILYALTATLAAVDWAMSLDPGFNSSIFGLIFIAHQLLGALAIAILLARAPAKPGALGALLLAAILLWAYLHAMQFLIIWTGDLPDEIRWYIARATHGWQVATWVLFVGQGAVPFGMLLSSRVRSDPVMLRALALLTLAMRLLEGIWLAVPGAAHG